MKIFFGINVPYLTSEIDFDATDARRKELEKTKDFVSFLECRVFVPCIKYKDLSFELCECCGSQVVGGRAKRGWRSCSPECNRKIGSAWAAHTITVEGAGREAAGILLVPFPRGVL